MFLKKILKIAPVILALFFCYWLFAGNYQPGPLQTKYATWLRALPPQLKPTPYLCVVVLGEQKNYVFYNGKFVKSYVVATGSKTRYESDRTLRTGVWRLNGRIDHGLEPLYGPRLIYLQFYNSQKKEFVKTLKAFHGTNEPEILGTPQSMGCVYHSNADILELYNLLPDNTLVIVTKD